MKPALHAPQQLSFNCELILFPGEPRRPKMAHTHTQLFPLSFHLQRQQLLKLDVPVLFIGVSLDEGPRPAHPQPITSGVLIAEFLTCIGQLAIVVTYDSIEKSVSKENEYFIACLEGVVRTINGLVIVMGDFDARIGRQLKGVVGSTKQRGIRLTC